MRRWLRRRRERTERIEIEADELVRLLGDDAYSEARWREHTASSPASAQHWNLIALAIARQTGTRIGLDLSTRLAMMRFSLLIVNQMGASLDLIGDLRHSMH